MDFQSKNPEDLEHQIEERKNKFDVYEKETNVRICTLLLGIKHDFQARITDLETDLSSREETIRGLEQSVTDLEQEKSSLVDELAKLSDENR